MSNAHAVTPPRGIDHLVIAAHDLSALAEQWRRLGFQVGGQNLHPWGTANHIVQFPGSFIELIGVAEAKRIPDRTPASISFGAYIRDFLRGGEGGAALALESTNAIADAAAFRLARIGEFEPFHFERQGIGPDGQPRRVSFTLAFADWPDTPRAGFFTCQQHQPQNFWNAERQIHANGVSAIKRIVLVAEDPSDFHEFLDYFVNQREMRATSYGLELDTGRGMIEVLSPEAFAFRYGQPAPVIAGQGLQFAAVEFRVASVDALKASLGAARAEANGQVIVAPQNAGGILLAFSAS